ncbi:MAG: phage terminase large subunit [Candidatus Contendobacter sp.]|jgi:predicted phage terminase large subunit-like protein|nr:phage terminase large subunit [Candidatus Contendobacter sp.]
MAGLTLFLPPLHPLQRQVAQHPARYRVIAAGRRWGKSRLAAALCLKSALRPSGGRAFWIAPTYKIAEVGWREIKGLARQLGAVIHEQDKRAAFGQTGGWIQVRSADDPQSLRGEGLDFVVFDEAAFTKEEAWTEAIRPALADRQGHGLFISSPNGKNWFHRLWEYGQRESPDWQSWRFPTASNPYIPPAEIEAARAEMFSLTFQQEFMAEFVDATGAVLKREWLATGEPDGHPAVVLGVDLALSTKTDADWTAIVALSRDAAGTVYIRDAQRIRAPFHQVLQFIQQMAAKWNPTIIAIEQVQYQAAVVQELNRTTALPIRGVRPDKDKLTRFLPLAARYEQGIVQHAPGLPGWFEDELLSFPVGEHDDAADALAYSFAALGLTLVYDYHPIPARSGHALRRGLL